MATDRQVTLTINGRSVTVPKGMLLVEAAKRAGLEIPVFCYHPKLKPVGACRMCLVEIEKMPRLQTACTTPVTEGMVVRTGTPQVIAAQNGVIELLLANHPLDCPICDKGGECPLQDNTFKFGLGTSRFTEDKRHQDKAFPLSDRIVLDKERCIMCLRCVRFQQEIPGDEALALVQRGGRSEVGVLPGESFDSPFSGNTIELCPVGALTSRQYRFQARPWDLKRTPSVCAGCAVGCNVELHSRDGRILRIVSRQNPEVDDGWLCDAGRFGTLAAVRRQRATEPLVREHGAGMNGHAPLRPASWEEALARAAGVLTAGASGLLISPALTNEALWLLGNVLLPRLAGRDASSHSGAPAACWPHETGHWPLEGKIADLAACKSLVLIGLDPWKELPVLALWLRRAVQQGARLVVVGASNGLFRDTAHWLQVEAGREAEVAAALLRSLEGLRADAGLRTRDSGPEFQNAAPAAAAGALSRAPAAVLAGPAVVRDEAARGTLQALAERLGADPAQGGMRGSPSLAVNGRGVLELAPRLALVEAQEVLAACRGGRLAAVLLAGDAAWPETGGASVVQLTSGPVLEREGVEVVLPLAHLYEQAGSLTNLAGRVQRLVPGGLAPRLARPDWAAVADLATALGASAPNSLAAIRTALVEAIPTYAPTLSGELPPTGRLLRAREASLA